MFPVQPLSLLHTDSYDSITEMLFSDLYFYAFVVWNCGISHKESPPFFFLCEMGHILQTHSFSDQITWASSQSLIHYSIQFYYYYINVYCVQIYQMSIISFYMPLLQLQKDHNSYGKHCSLSLNFLCFCFRRLQNVIAKVSSVLRMQYQSNNISIQLQHSIQFKKGISSLSKPILGLLYLHLYDSLRMIVIQKQSYLRTSFCISIILIFPVYINFLQRAFLL